MRGPRRTVAETHPSDVETGVQRLGELLAVLQALDDKLGETLLEVSDLRAALIRDRAA